MAQSAPLRSITVIYIAGYAYSATTLLDVMLSSIDQGVGLGEVTRVEKEKVRRSFRIDELDDEYRKWWRSVLWGRVQDELDRIASEDSSILKRLQDDNGRFGSKFFRQAAEYFDVSYIVDSSKTTPRNIWRPLYLQSEGLEVAIVHPVRHPRSLLNSYVHKGRGSRLALLWELMKWVGSNVATYYLYRGGRYCALDYHSYLDNPQSALERIGSSLSIPTEAIIERLDAGDPFPQGGGFLGNAMRREKEIYFDPPEKRAELLPRDVQMVSNLCAPVYRHIVGGDANA